MSLKVHLEKPQELSCLEKTSLANLVRAAWAILLRCYTGQDDVHFGYSANDGWTNEPEAVVAWFKLEGSRTLNEIVDLREGKFPGEASGSSAVLQDASEAAERHLFNTAVSLRGIFNPTRSGTSSSSALLNLSIPHALSMRLLVQSNNDVVSLFLEWWNLAMPVSQAHGIAGTLSTIVTSLLTRPRTTRLHDLAYISDYDLQRISSWNSNALDEVNDCIHSLFRRQAERRPDAEAVCAWDGTLSYRQLDELSDYVACRLVEKGVRPETRVPTCFDKSKWNIVAMLGVLKAGGAFVPLDPSQPLPRLHYYLDVVDAKIVLCAHRYSKLLLGVFETLMVVDENVIDTPLPQRAADPGRVGGNNAAYVMFTSGSTGEPKGTVIEHAAFCTSAMSHAQRFHFTEISRVLQFAAHTFDASLAESLTVLLCGACVCIPREEERLNDISSVINTMRVDVASFTPSFANFLHPSTVPGLKVLILGGEAMLQHHVETWSGLTLVNTYGPTEASVWCIINPRVTLDTGSKDIGFPCAIHCWITDPENHDRLMPVGSIGELLLEGPLLARCYLKNPEKTAESFILDPVWSRGSLDTHRRFYKTGDLVRYNVEKGSLVFIGRKDTQVKFHGQRIELGEIEHHLNRDGLTEHGVVVLPKEGPCKQRLVAIFTTPEPRQLSAGQPKAAFELIEGPTKDLIIQRLNDQMMEGLPSYMIPTIWIYVAALPFLSSGKLDRKKITQWTEGMDEDVYLRINQRLCLEGSNSKDWSSTEEILRDIWSCILNLPLEHIVPDRSFLSLGGDSLTAIACMSQCKKAGLRINVQDVLRAKSISELADCVKPMPKAQLAFEENLDEPFDLAPMQRAYFETWAESQGHFNRSALLYFSRFVQQEAVAHAIETIVKRHSMLHVRFAQTDDGWHQYISSDVAGSYRFRVHVLENEGQMRQIIAISQSDIDIRHGPVFNADFFDICGGKQLLFLTGHTLLADLASWEIILHDLDAILDWQGSTMHWEKSLPFQVWCKLSRTFQPEGDPKRKMATSGRQSVDLAYWAMHDKSNCYGDVVLEGFELDSYVTEIILQRCNGPLRTETVDLLLSSLFSSFLLLFADRDPPVIHNEIHGRQSLSGDIDVSRTVGPFSILNRIAPPVKHTDSLVEIIARIKDCRRRANDGLLVSAGSGDTDGSSGNRAVAEILFTYLGLERTKRNSLFKRLRGTELETYVSGSASDLAATASRASLFEVCSVVEDGKLKMSFAFNRGMQHQEKIRDWVKACEKSLLAIAQELPATQSVYTLSDFPLLDLDYAALNVLQEKLPELGVSSLDDVEDIYPCAPLVQGLLLSKHARDAAYYAVCGTWEVKAVGVDAVNTNTLARAWKDVVMHHAALRTVFAEGLSSQGLYDQVVVKNVDVDPVRLACPDEDVLGAFDHLGPLEYNDTSPQHRFAVCETASQKVFCRLEISHAIVDGTSLSIILRDLKLAYSGRLRSRQAPLYSNFISHIQEQPFEDGLNYWKTYLTGMDPCHLPELNDGTRTEKALHSIRLKLPEVHQLQSFCTNNGLTVNNMLNAAWYLTLRCYTGSEDVCFGYLSSGRNENIQGAADAVGPFINMLTCRVRGTPSMTLKEVVNTAQQDFLAALPYQHISLAEVQHSLQLSGVALFNTCISCLKLPDSGQGDVGSIDFAEYTKVHDPTEYPVSLYAEVSAAAITIDMDYWTDSVSDGQASNVASTFTHHLEYILREPETPLKEIELVSADIKEQIWAWNCAMPEIIEQCVHEVVKGQSIVRPEAEAICAWDGRYTYAQLESLSARLAHHLIKLGVGPETLVPTCFDKSAWAVVAMLAVLKAGGGCVPLDATYPLAALKVRIMECGAHVVVASASRAVDCEATVPYVVAVGPELFDHLPADCGELSTDVRPSNTSFVIFTSGSTGKPKGVVLEHQAIVTSAQAHGSALAIGPDTRFLQFATYTFDNSLEEMFTTLMRGGCVCIPSEDDRMNNLAKAIGELRANFMDLTPTVASFLNPEDVPSIKSMAVGGEALTQKVVDIWASAIPIHNQYGPSECSINATHNGNVSVGKDVSNLGYSVGSISWIVDQHDHQRLVPIGCAGELLIEGPILARGYLNDTPKTAAAFIENPIWARQDPYHHERGARRMYKTGDLVRYNSDGSLSYLGRKDTQVKLNGQRVELGEIEHHLKLILPSEAQSTVELVSPGGKAKTLSAFICLASSDSDDARVLPMSQSFQDLARAAESTISDRIASYMVPSMYIPVSKIPLTSSGKTDRRALRNLATSLTDEEAATYRLCGRSGREPATGKEKAIQGLWASVLNVNPNSIGADDSFFRHGGDSITAMRLVNNARTQGIVLSVASIFQTPRLSDLARHAQFASPSPPTHIVDTPVQPFKLLRGDFSVEALKAEAATICAVDPASIEDIYPCTAIQEALVALSSRQPGAYVAMNSFKLPKDINIPRFKRAWLDVFGNEPILRTRIAFITSVGFVQVVVRETINWFSFPSMRAVPDTMRHLPAQDGSVLSQYVILGEGSSDSLFLWIVHHALYDGWSLPVLLRRVEERYENPQTPIVPTPSFSRFVEYISRLDTSASEQYWRNRLLDSTAPQYPQLPHVGYDVKATRQVKMSAQIKRPVSLEFTDATVLRAAWAWTLSIYSNCDDVIFGEILTGRDVPVQGVEDMLGPTLASVPTRLLINRDLNCSDFIRDIQQQLSAAMSHQFLGLQRIRKLGPEISGACNFQNLLAINHADEPSKFWDLVSMGTVGTNFYTYPLNIVCTIERQKVDIEAQFDPNVITDWQVSRMLRLLQVSVNYLTALTAKKVGDVDLVIADDVTTILSWQTNGARLINKTIHQSLEEQVAIHSKKVAVCAWHGNLTYAELHQLSNNLASKLRTRGVGQGGQRFVPLCFEKSGYAIIAMFAVMKAGGAFVPLDPTHPAARLRSVMEDIGGGLILCSPQQLALCETIASQATAVDMKMLGDLEDTAHALLGHTPDQPAYAIFTSGTTGKPKGTIVSHTAFCSGAAVHGPALRINAGSRFFQFASYTFDASLVEILTTLLHGGTVCVPSDFDRLNNPASTMERMGVNISLLTPSFVQLIKPSDVPSLRTLILGGEGMSKQHLTTWAEKVTLVNAYGPTECAVVATVNSRMNPTSHPANIGTGVDKCWIVDPRNHNRLVPIGSIGELVVEGYTLAEGYLNDDTKTAQAFTEIPSWSSGFTGTRQHESNRAYKTGDLVKVASDVTGEMIFIGRKDTQTKVNGQRLELDEVELHLAADSSIRHVYVTVPKSGLCAGKLVALLSLSTRSVSGSSSEDLQAVASHETSSELSMVKERLCRRLPAYMIPSKWIVVNELPLLSSGKLDRRKILGFIEGVSQELYEDISHSERLVPPQGLTQQKQSMDAADIEKRLQTIWGHVLNLNPAKVSLNQSFLHLGGDSISAMQVMAQCRSEDIGITVQDIIRSRSIIDLATRVRLPEQTKYQGEDPYDFDLSPIQQLYFTCVGKDIAQFNQSVLLRACRKVDPDDVGRAIKSLVESHSMLRVRFRKDGTDSWRQRITQDVPGSYRFRVHNVTSTSRMRTRIEDSQKCLNIVKGPILAADLFTVAQKEVILFIAIHHLSVDIVSWNVILQDLEDILSNRRIQSRGSIPFQTWCRLQAENAQEQNKALVLPDDRASSARLDYWGMKDRPNLHRDTVSESIEFDTRTTELLIGGCHQALQTDTLDILLAVLLQAHRNSFLDRQDAPTIFNEGHGRESWDPKLDLSRTVGWFTTLSPVHLPSEASPGTELISAIRWVKDLRRRTPDSGRAYFAYRLLTSDGKKQYNHHWPMEIAFNYMGQMQQHSRDDSLFQAVKDPVNQPTEIGAVVPRFALIEITAVATQRRMQLSFSWNKHMDHQSKIKEWMAQTKYLLREAPERLLEQQTERTLSEFPLLPMAYHGSEKLALRAQDLGHSVNDLENAYPCTPMQRGLILSQLKDPERYLYYTVFEVRPSRSEIQVDLHRLTSAWQAVVQRHSTLRTIFVQSVGRDDLMDQVVIKRLEGRIRTVQCSDDGAFKTLARLGRLDCSEKKPPHRLSICEDQDHRIYCKLEISHVISDGSSVPILLRDLADAYSKVPIASGALPLYSNYIAYLHSQPREESIDYWIRYLEGVEPCLFPALNEGVTRTQGTLSCHIIHLKQVSKLQKFCTRAGLTLSNVLQLVWGLVLRQYTGQDEVCFGYLASGRDLPVKDIDQAVGAFINMLICRINLPNELEVGDALDKIQADFGAAMSYQTASLAEIQHELNLAGTSLFNTAFTFQKRVSTKDAVGSDVMCEIVEAHDPSEYSVAINIEATDANIEVHFSYWTNVLSHSQVSIIADTFEKSLGEIIDDATSELTIGSLDFLGERSLQRIATWNQGLPGAIDRCIHDIFRQHVHFQPSAPAICSWDGNFTYSELDKVTTRVAKALQSLGVRPGVYVPLCFEKSIWTVVAQLSVLKAGGAFVNLDPAHPESRLRNLVNEVGSSLVICSQGQERKASQSANRIFVLGRGKVEQLQQVDSSLAVDVKPSDPAYVIFTSGTTGVPKGTVIEHGAFCTGATAHGKAMFMSSSSRVFQFASYTFDASVMEIFSTLLVGGCVCIPSDEDRLNDIAGAIRKMDINWTLLTPSVAGTLKPESVPCLKVLVTGGEAMSAGHIDKWREHTAVVNAYGPTETSVVATVNRLVDEEHCVLSEDRFNIGKAVGGRGWVVDHRDYNSLVPVGAVGELVIEGRLVARGYLNNELKTKEAFVQDPRWTKHPRLLGLIQSCGRMYRTGDLVRYNLDGSYSYISRKDTQIKLNGQRIELGEIEYQCRQNLPGQAQAAVELVVPSNRKGTKALAVFFHLNQHGGLPLGDDILLPMDSQLHNVAKRLEDNLANVLPAYMIPQIYVPVAYMPWMPSGKLDRRRMRQALEALSKETIARYRLASGSTSRRELATAMESKLQKLWERVMKLPSGSVGTEDNFFRLGGDSLAAMSLVGAARAEFLSLTVTNIFKKPKLSDMALTCEAITEEAELHLNAFSLLQNTDPLTNVLQEIKDQCRVKQESIQDVYPCSSLQEGLFTLTIKQRGAYVARDVFKLPSDLDIDRFKMAWQKTVDTTDTLRTRIVHTSAGEFLQVVLDDVQIEWHSAESIHGVTNDTIPEHNGGALTRYTLIGGDSAPNKFFVLQIHHALYDGWSFPLLLQRVEGIYRKGKADITPAPYAKFIQYLQKSDFKAAESFWRSHLTGASSMHFPSAPHSASQQAPCFRTAVHYAPVARKDISSEITIPSLVRASWGLVLSAYTGAEDVVFGEILTGRNIDVPGITDIIGPTFTTVPTRIHLTRDATVPEFLKQVQDTSTELIPHQHLGLQNIRRLDNDASVACDFQNLLSIQTMDEKTDDAFWDIQVEDAASADNFFTHPLVVEVKVGLSEFALVMYYNENVISAWQAQRMLYQLECVLKQMSIASKKQTVSLKQIDVVSLEDKELISQWNRLAPDSTNSCIHELISKRVNTQPSAQAVCSWDCNLTYRQLNDYASRLAIKLRALGVGPEKLVPICVDKSAWTIVAILAILLAGAAFVPLDGSHPPSRHQEILEETQANTVLCSPGYLSRFSALVENTLGINRESVTTLPSVQRSEMLPQLARSSNAAYIIFTSGSTGRPKGVVVEHGAFCSSSKAFSKIMLMKQESRVFHFASLTFDAAVMEILSTLISGGCICVPSADERLKDLAGAFNRMQVSWALLTPSVVNLIEPSAVPSLKTLVCGGEAMLSETVAKWAKNVKLMNAYGPAEASVIVTINSRLSTDRDPTCIGQATSAVNTWIIDPNDHDRIAPVGAVGELAVSGPVLAREYLRNPSKTAESFVVPAWSSQFKVHRVYKTGDLAKYTPNGTLEFMGRKDNQVKVNGQRLEVGEIENRLDADPHVLHALVILPKTGPCKKRLVAVIALKGLSSNSASFSANRCAILTEPQALSTAKKELKIIRDQLSDQLPAYMVPQIWAVIESMPMLVSGKLDRKQVSTWVGNLDNKTHELIMDLEDDAEEIIEATGTSKVLREVWATVLNLPVEDVRLNKSFLSLGGDSISAMGVMSRCRKVGISVSLQDVLQAKSIGHLVQRVGTSATIATREEKVEEPFPLSPIQQLYFKSATHFNGQARFNQSFSLRIAHPMEVSTIKQALDVIVDHHSMLRARFSRNDQGLWEQRISKEIVEAYCFRVHSLNATNEIPALVATTQASLHIERGPVFAAEIFNIRGGDQMIFLAAHHLCIDMVSWRIILQDLQEFLEVRSLGPEKPLSFQSWCAMQAAHTQNMDARNLLPFYVPPTNLAYWGMENLPNTYSQVIEESFALDAASTQLALGKCHEALNTEPLDLLLAALLHSFAVVFTDRATPTVYNENHGREASWNSSIDLSRTVGWFTTICPLVVPVKTGTLTGIVDTLRQTKDIRRRIPENGRPYFAHQFLTPEGRLKAGISAVPMELMFNYLGRMQQLERSDSLLQQVEFSTNERESKDTGDVGPDTSRLALFEISAIVRYGKLELTWMYNRHIQRASEISRWTRECKRTLEQSIRLLESMPTEPTLSDYPLLPITYDGLKKLVEDIFPRVVGVSHFSQVEDVYPCSPIQEGLLISQLRDPSTYVFHTVYELKHVKGKPIDPRQMGKAWQMVVKRHAALRTVFIDSVYRGGMFDQVVVKDVDSGVMYLECDENEVEKTLAEVSIRDTNWKKKPQLPHQMTICSTPNGRVFCKAEINHVVIDGGSVAIMLDDLTEAYEERLPDGPGPLYSDYIRYIKSQPLGSDTKFWATYLKGLEPCYFPKLNTDPTAKKQLASINVPFARYPELHEVVDKMKVTMSNLMHTAWALVLRKYTGGSNDICFGYLSSGRDIPVDNIEWTIGAFINMLCCRVRLSPSMTLEEAFRMVQEEYITSIPYQRCSLAQVQHDLGLAGKALYNTSLSIQNHSREQDRAEETIIFDMSQGHDPSEYIVTVNVELEKGHEGVLLRYWQNLITDAQANEIAQTMSNILEHFIGRTGELVTDIELFEGHNKIHVNRSSLPGTQLLAAVNSAESIKQASPTEGIEGNKASETELNRQLFPVSRPQVSGSPNARTNESRGALQENTGLKQIITECVEQVLDQMFKSGAIVPGNVPMAQLTGGAALGQLERANESHGIRLSGAVPPSINQVDGSGLEETVSRDNSMAARISRRGRSAQTEHKLLRAWSLTLEISPETITSGDSFFELGGDSITAMKLVSAAKDEGLNLTVADVFRNPTFEEMATIIRVASMMSTYISDTDLQECNAHHGGFQDTASAELYERFSLVKATNINAFLQSSICPKVGVFKGGIADLLPVTDFQALAITGTLLESRWMLNYFFLDGSGHLDLRQLKQSCFRIVQAFDILRTVFLPSGDRFLQVVLRKLRPAFQVFETDLPLEEFRATLQQKDREDGPRLGEAFVQFTVVKRKDSERHMIIMRISHAQYDGVCLPKILAALQEGYQGAPIPTTPSFANYVRSSAGMVATDHYQYWKSLLKGSFMTEIVRRNGPNYQRSDGSTTAHKRKIRLPPVAHGGITTATVIKAAWAYVLAQLTARADVVFGHTISGRNAAVPGIEYIIGPCINMVPVRIQFQEEWTALDLLRYVQEQQIANMPYEALGFREIIKHCTEWPDWTNFTTAVLHQNVDRGSEMKLGPNTYKVGGVGADEDFADFSIVSLPLLDVDHMVEVILQYNCFGAVTSDFAAKVHGMLCNAAEEFTANPNMPLLSPAGLRTLTPQTLDDITVASDEPFQSAHLQGLSRAEMLVLSDILNRAWRQVLRDPSGESVPPIHLDSSFFDLGGDIMGLAQVSWFLEQEEGCKVRVEELIDHPTMLGHMAVLAAHNARLAAKKAASTIQAQAQPSSSQTGAPAVPKGKPALLPLQKAVGLARKMVKRNIRSRQSQTPA